MIFFFQCKTVLLVTLSMLSTPFGSRNSFVIKLLQRLYIKKRKGKKILYARLVNNLRHHLHASSIFIIPYSSLHLKDIYLSV